MSQINLSWSSDTDPAVGWNLYLSHFSTPNALEFIAQLGPSNRSTVLHNIQSSLYQVGLSRVDKVTVDEVDRPIEGPISVIAFVIPDQVSVPDAVESFTGEFVEE